MIPQEGCRPLRPRDGARLGLRRRQPRRRQRLLPPEDARRPPRAARPLQGLPCAATQVGKSGGFSKMWSEYCFGCTNVGKILVPSPNFKAPRHTIAQLLIF